METLKRNIVLIGFMGTGKSVVARRLAGELHLEYVSTDDRIEKREGCSIKEIFASKGEAHFRDIEASVIRDITAVGGQVIDAGGGAVIRHENLEAFKQNGTLICLTARPDVILKRTSGKAHRPLLNVENPLARIEELLTIRAPYYAQADTVIDTSVLTVGGVVDRIRTYVQREHGRNGSTNRQPS